MPTPSFKLKTGGIGLLVSQNVRETRCLHVKEFPILINFSILAVCKGNCLLSYFIKTWELKAPFRLF